MSKPTVVKEGTSGYMIFTQQHETWPGCGYESKTTEIKVRNVNTELRKEVQLEISITEVKSNRLYRKHAGLTLAPNQADIFIAAMLKTNVPLPPWHPNVPDVIHIKSTE